MLRRTIYLILISMLFCVGIKNTEVFCDDVHNCTCMVDGEDNNLETQGIYQRMLKNSNFIVTKTVNIDDEMSFPKFNNSCNLSNSKYFPSIREQLGGSCSTWATTYYQFTYQVTRMKNVDAKNDENVFSPKYVYNYLNIGDYNKGVDFESCYNFLSLFGCVRYNEFIPNTLSNEWYYNSNESEMLEVLHNALNIKVSKVYKHVIEDYTPNTITSEVDSNVINYIKSYINEGKVITFSTYINGFEISEMTNGEQGCIGVYDNKDYSYNENNKRSTHALTIVGYDDNISSKKYADDEGGQGAFLVANSWGTDYGNDGFIWLTYDALNSISSCNGVNNLNRICAFEGGCFYTIEVVEKEPMLTAELKLTHVNRGDFKISIGSSETIHLDNYDNMFDYLRYSDYIKPGCLDFLGNKDSSRIRKTHYFVLDFSDVYSGSDMNYWIELEDGEDLNSTVVESVKWIDSSNTVIKNSKLEKTINNCTAFFDSCNYVESLNLNHSSQTLFVGQSDILTVGFIPQNATNKLIEWESSHSKIIKVDQSGKVVAVGKGTAEAIAKAMDGSGKTISCTYTVKQPVTSIEIKGYKSNLAIGDTNQLNAVVLPESANNRNIEWKSSNTSVLTVTSNGLVEIKNRGTATVTATAKDGSGIFTTCTYVIIDDYPDNYMGAKSMELYDELTCKMDSSFDVDFFKFVPESTGKYVIFSLGNTDVRCNLYEDSIENKIAYDDDGNIYNLGIIIELTAGKTYYLEVDSYSGEVGEYTLHISRSIENVYILDKNQDARNFQMSVEASEMYDSLLLVFGDKEYVLKKPSSGDLVLEVGDSKIKVQFIEVKNKQAIRWVINAKVPATIVGKEDKIKFVFGADTLSDESNTITGIVAYKSTIKTGITEGMTIPELIDKMSQEGYSLTIRNWDNALINYGSETKATTGMKIIKKDMTTGNIVEIYYTVIFGDVSENMGDGLITTSDQLAVLKYASKNIVLNDINIIAADVNQDGIVDTQDALLIAKHASRLIEISQDYSITVVPDSCYFLDPIAF